ncbi:hypothetical protein, partial [Pedobacter sp. UBA5917]|uniref:hypothetical protein n=1 Tax=Pedobacter sp. UBA5917 TaxID=1947061 RepID=UPI0025DC5851
RSRRAFHYVPVEMTTLFIAMVRVSTHHQPGKKQRQVNKQQIMVSLSQLICFLYVLYGQKKAEAFIA